MTTGRELESLKITCKLRDAELQAVATSKAAGECTHKVTICRCLISRQMSQQFWGVEVRNQSTEDRWSCVQVLWLLVELVH